MLPSLVSRACARLPALKLHSLVLFILDWSAVGDSISMRMAGEGTTLVLTYTALQLLFFLCIKSGDHDQYINKVYIEASCITRQL